ncbi:MAG: hypothetical protein NT012_02100 [Candidatus Nealsonbacteria bacterium]|nr:hypothetical protein [Candidatus Nealsonbacteria bacterium]
MRKLPFYLLVIFGLSFVFAEKALAVCPICIIAVGAGVGFSRWLGIDDTITGLWIGGLIVSLIIWTLDWLDRKNIHFKGRNILTALIYYAFLIFPLYFAGLIGGGQNSLFCWCGWHFDKLTLGVIVGSISFWFGAEWYHFLKEKNNGRAYFPFQKVVLPISPLILLSIIFYFLIK